MSRVRPGDLVGAFAGEAGIAGNDVGAIHITERFSVVEVRQELVQMVIERMQGATIRGRRVQVRPYQPRR